MTSSDGKALAGYVDLILEAAPLIAVAASKGGSLFYKSWLDKAQALGILNAKEFMADFIPPTSEDTSGGVE